MSPTDIQNEFLSLFASEPSHSDSAVTQNDSTWKILVVDDETDIHSLFRLALQDVIVEGLPLQLLYANSAEQAKAVLSDHPDIVLVLLDVVMETVQAGLVLAHYIRQELNNHLIQIVLITGQPGYAPQRSVVVDYEINGYRLKSELTADRIFVPVYVAIRTHHAMSKIAHQKRLLDEADRQSQEERMLRASIVESSEDAIIGKTLDGIVTSWNRAAENIFSYTAEEMVGHSLNDIIPSDRKEEDKRLMGAILQGEVLSLFETERIRKNAARINILMTMSPIYDMEGRIVGISEISRDITERKQAEAALLESENRYHALLHNAQDAILIADLNGSLTEINPAGELLFGYSRDEILHMNVVNLHPADELAKVRQCFEGFRENICPLVIETKIICKNGRVVDVEVRPSLVEINGYKLTQGVFIDLTERKRNENERLAAENIHRDALIREVHHRIKNNMQGITGILHRFIGNHPETTELLNQVISQMQSIAVIHGLQGLAVASSVRVCEMTVAIAAGIEALWQESIIVSIPEDWIPCVINEAEAVPLALILNELISNAVKHGGANRQVKIMISHEPNPGSIRLTIHNAGLISAKFGRETTIDFGIGLQLVASLLPREGARLTWTQRDDIVVTTLVLDEPVIQLELPTVRKDEY